MPSGPGEVDEAAVVGAGLEAAAVGASSEAAAVGADLEPPPEKTATVSATMPHPGLSEFEGSEKTAETPEDTATHERLSKLVETAQEKRVRTIRTLWAELQKSREENLELRERLSRSEARALSSQASQKMC